jgi:LacI family transcriptional regulator
LTTIQDVAKKAGVSTATVSHVLNSTRFVSGETRETVLQAIQELNYHPSTIARSLSTRKTNTIGMVVSHITNPFFGEMIRGVVDVITPQNYSLLLCTTEENPDQEEAYFRLLFGRAVDGFIAAATSRKWAAMQMLEAAQAPIVFVDRKFEGMSGPFVGVDNEGGAYQAVSHLIQDGHTRIGLVAGPSSMSTMQERLRGYRNALREHGIPFDEGLIACGDLGVDEGRRCALDLLHSPSHPTALFCNNNLLTLGTLLALKQSDRKCPDDVALAVFDDHPWAAVASPALTAVRQPAYEVGRTAATLMLQTLGGELIVQERVILETELIVRQSCKAGYHY